MNRYDELKRKHQEEFGKFSVAFAFSDEQFKKGLEKLGLTENDTDKITGIGAGGFIKKTDLEAYIEMHKRFANELKDEINNKTTGEQFSKDMFESELANNEYGYTRNLDDTLSAIGYTIVEVNDNENLKNGLSLALAKYEKEEEEENYQ